MEPAAPGPAAQEYSAQAAAAQARPGSPGARLGAPGGLSRDRTGLPLGIHRAARPDTGRPRGRGQMPVWERRATLPRW